MKVKGNAFGDFKPSDVLSVGSNKPKALLSAPAMHPMGSQNLIDTPQGFRGLSNSIALSTLGNALLSALLLLRFLGISLLGFNNLFGCT